MATQRDYYEILGVDRGTDDETIKRAYRKMAMKFHPDRNSGDREAEIQFKEAAEAYEVLSDSNKRERYDRFGHAGLRGTSTHDFHHMDPGDIFSMFDDIFGEALGGSRRSNRGRTQRGYDLETQTEISLEEVASGVEREINFTRQDVCDTCDGTGGKPGTDPVACVTCAGAGQVQQAGFGGMFRMVTTCPACRGARQSYAQKCTACHGTGRCPKKRQLTIKIPPGVHDGQAVRIAGEGEPGSNANGQRGDLHVVVRVQAHELFVRDGDDLIMKMPISFTQAALGATVSVPTIDGPRLSALGHELVIKRGTQHGEVVRVPNRGLVNLRSQQRDSLLVVLQIEIPKKLTENQKQLLQDFSETENRDVMPQSHGFWEKMKSYLN